jgi:oxalate decarboxylase/phosphoglucose isomerase-like protein (cupin superfamily)
LVDGKWVAVAAGQSIDLPPGTLHTFSNTGDVPCRWLNVHSPKGFVSFSDHFGVDANDPDAFAKSIDPKVIDEVL